MASVGLFAADRLELTGPSPFFLSGVLNTSNLMADEKKSSSTSTAKAAPAKTSTPAAKGGQNGKGDAPRNCFSDSYRSNFDGIDWSK